MVQSFGWIQRGCIIPRVTLFFNTNLFYIASRPVQLLWGLFFIAWLSILLEKRPMQLGSLHSFGTKLQCKCQTQWPIAGLRIGNNIELVLNFYFPVLANESTTLKLHKEIERERERKRERGREKVTKSPKRLNSIVIIYLISLDKHGSFWLESFIYLINNDFVQCQAAFTLSQLL